jgi:hypothetical protein
MNWVNSKSDQPEAGEEVLVRSRGIYNLAVYNSKTREFELKNGARYSITKDELEWTRVGKNSELIK